MQRSKKTGIIYFFSILIVNIATAHAYDIKPSFVLAHAAEKQDLLENIKKIINFKESFDSMDEVNERLKFEEERLKRYLSAYGYYAADVHSKIIFTNKKQVRVNFFITPNKAFKINRIYIQAGKYTKKPSINVLEIKEGDILLAQQVLDAENTLEEEIESLNCLAKIAVSHQAILDFRNYTADLTFKVAEYPQVRFGSTELKGLETVKPEFVLREISWHQGDCFKPTMLKGFRASMRKKSVFSDVNILYPDQAAFNDEIPITMEFKESLHRTVKIGAGYNSDEGPGLYGHWEHRNYFGMAEHLNVDTTINSLLQNIIVQYLNPYFYREDRDLIITSELKHEDTDQYEAASWISSANIKHTFKEHWYFQYGIGYHLSKVQDFSIKNTFGLLYLPLSAGYDSRDNILDPSKGILLNLAISPYWDTFDQSTFFLKSKLDGSTYWSLNKSRFTILATRVAIGSIAGSSSREVPADLRFYAGGGQSVRGYKYQSLGTVINDISQGGRSLIEASIELRQKISDTYGFVVFLDGGNVFDEKIPDFSQTLRWAVGLGVRYYTKFGPIRFDVGVPVNKRPDIDDSYQIYISIGQAY